MLGNYARKKVRERISCVCCWVDGPLVTPMHKAPRGLSQFDPQEMCSHDDYNHKPPVTHVSAEKTGKRSSHRKRNINLFLENPSYLLSTPPPVSKMQAASHFFVILGHKKTLAVFSSPRYPWAEHYPAFKPFQNTSCYTTPTILENQPLCPHSPASQLLRVTRTLKSSFPWSTPWQQQRAQQKSPTIY